jgi:hypothetical protein
LTKLNIGRFDNEHANKFKRFSPAQTEVAFASTSKVPSSQSSNTTKTPPSPPSSSNAWSSNIAREMSATALAEYLMRCVEAINLFERHENALGIRSMALREAPQFPAIDIEGVILSIRPDFLVEGQSDRIGAGIVRVAKAPDPANCKLEETRRKRGDHRREMGRYMVAMLQLLLEAQGDQFGIVDRDLCFIADIRIGERIGPASNHTNRLRAIRAACRQIASLWPGIRPRPSVFRK